MTSSSSGPADAWRRANDLFHLALEMPASEREGFLQRSCQDDEALRREVRALLDAHSRADSFLDQPVVASGQSAAAAVAAASESMVGREIGHYRIQRVLGVGGMGVVYLAQDDRLGRLVALKAIAPAFTHDPGRRERLRREARAAAGLMHPGIAMVYAFEEVDDHVFIVGEYVAGETLRDELARGPLTAVRTVETALGIAGALAVAHDRGIVHRDLKPENVIRTPAGQIKILDFGLARFRDSTGDQPGLTEDGTILGTPAYMSPEQIRRDVVDGRADLFALGAVMYELATGVHPFLGRDAASTIARILEVDPPGFGETGADTADARRVRTALGDIVRICLRKAPETRFSTAHELVAALERARAGRSDSVPVPWSTSGLALRWWKFHQAATIVSYAGVIAALWWARGGIGSTGRYLFFAALAAGVASSVLRLHLWFTAASLPAEWRQQHRSSKLWLRIADTTVAATCLVGGVLEVDTRPGLAAALLCAAVAILLSFAVIEPATTRAAFGRE